MRHHEVELVWGEVVGHDISLRLYSYYIIRRNVVVLHFVLKRFITSSYFSTLNVFHILIGPNAQDYIFEFRQFGIEKITVQATKLFYRTDFVEVL